MTRLRPVGGCFAGILFFTLFACATKPPVVTAPSSLSRKPLFPNGFYTHRVKIFASGNRTYSFKGLVSLSEDRIKVVGLGFLNATAFRVNENRKTGDLNVEIYHEPMKKYEPKLRQFYSELHTLLLLSAREKDSEVARLKEDADGFPLLVRANGAEKSFEIQFENYDEKKIPRRFLLSRPEFQVEVEVTEYEI